MTLEKMFTLSDCLLKLGYRKLSMAVQDMRYSDLGAELLKIIHNEATRRKDCDIIDRLYFAGLLNG